MTFGEITLELAWIMFECFWLGVTCSLAFDAWSESREHYKS